MDLTGVPKHEFPFVVFSSWAGARVSLVHIRLWWEVGLTLGRRVKKDRSQDDVYNSFFVAMKNSPQLHNISQSCCISSINSMLFVLTSHAHSRDNLVT